MKTMILAAAATLAIGVGSAYAGDGEGGTAVAAEWAAQNGQSVATSPYAGLPTERQPVQQVTPAAQNYGFLVQTNSNG